ncbi:tail fiber protein [Vibrio phage K406]
MATSDKNIIAIANKDSLKYKSTRDYGGGSIVLKDKLFYEANGDVPSGTSFAEGDTGATWQLVGGTPIGDFDTTADYSTGDQVFHLGSLMQANTDISGAFDQTQWDIKVNLLNESVFSNTKTLTVNGDIELAGDYIEPEANDTLTIGSLSKALAGIYAQRYRFTDGAGNYKGEIDADGSNLEISSSEEIRLRAEGSSNISFSVHQNYVQLDNHNFLRLRDSDSSGKEYWDFGMNGNDIQMTYKGAEDDIGVYVKRVVVDGSAHSALTPYADNSGYLGTNSSRWIKIYAVDSTVSTSDGRLKDIHNQELPVSFIEAWSVHCKPKEWSWKDGKGSSGRKFGWIAQDVIKAFEVSGIDWRDYSLVEQGEDGIYHICKDECQAVENAVVRYKLEKAGIL